jgi:hypothetical protein
MMARPWRESLHTCQQAFPRVCLSAFIIREKRENPHKNTIFAIILRQHERSKRK